MPDLTGFPWGSHWTFAVWFRRTAGFNLTQGLFGNMPHDSTMGYSRADGSWAMYILASEKGGSTEHARLQFAVQTWPNGAFQNSSLQNFTTQMLPVGRWHHFVVTGNGVIMNAYLDAQPVAFFNKTTKYHYYDQPTPGVLMNSPHPVFIGSGDPLSPQQTSASFQGEMKDLYIYTQFFDAKDAAALYARTVHTLPTMAPTPAPTELPTISGSPTFAPTTASPTTSHPTHAPSAFPTISQTPTPAPTAEQAAQDTSSTGETASSGKGTVIAISIVVPLLVIGGLWYYYTRNYLNIENVDSDRSAIIPNISEHYHVRNSVGTYSENPLQSPDNRLSKVEPYRDHVPAPSRSNKEGVVSSESSSAPLGQRKWLDDL